MTPEGYQPLEGRLRGPLYSTRLYIGENHLLKSTVIGVHENYKRFAWEDIQAFTIRATIWGAGVNILCGFLLVCLVMTGVSWRPGPVELVFGYLPPFAAALGILIYNVSRGPTCQVRVRTAVSDETLGSLHRLETARRELEKLKAIILARQTLAARPTAGEGTPGVLSEGTTGALLERTPGALPAEPPAAMPGGQIRPPKPQDSGFWHRIALVMLALNFASCLIDLAWPDLGSAWDGLTMLIALGNLSVAFGVLLSQAKRASTPSLRVFGWLNFGYNVLMMLFLVGVIMVAMVQAAIKASGAGSLPDFETMTRPFTIVDSILVGLLLCYGAFAVFRHRTRPSAVPAAGA